MTCPVAGCQSTFTLKSSFTAHLSRKHLQCSVNNINDIYREIAPQSSATACEEASKTLEESTELPPNFNETFLRNVCLFYLKLQGQLLLLASTIQKNELNLTDYVMGKVCDCIKDSGGPLRTTYARAQTFKCMLKYVEPKAGYDENMRQRIAYYIPVKQTLISLLESELCCSSLMKQMHAFLLTFVMDKPSSPTSSSLQTQEAGNLFYTKTHLK